MDLPTRPRPERVDRNDAPVARSDRPSEGHGRRRALAAPLVLALPLALTPLAACAAPPRDAPGAGPAPAADAGPAAPAAGAASRAPDRDGDALTDREEAALGTRADAADTDGDGWIDGVEVRAGSDPRRGDSRPGPGSVQVPLPADGSPVDHPIPFRLRLDDADVLFLVDGTASMRGAIDSVRGSLGDVVAPGLARVLDRPRLGVAVVRDFPRDGHGAEGDRPFTLRSPLHPDLDATRRALDGVVARGGGDVPEAHVEAVGRAGDGDCRDAAAPGSRFGEACFAVDRTPVVVLVTDAPSHEGVNPAYRYGFPARRLAPTLEALTAWGVRVIGVAVHPRARPDLERLAAGTGALDGDGAPIVVDAPEGRAGQGIVEAVRGLAGTFTADVRLSLGAGPGAAWVRGVEAAWAAPPGGGGGGPVFRALPAGAEGAFALTLAAPTADPARGRVEILEVTVGTPRHAAPLVRRRLLLWAPPTTQTLR